MQCLSKSARSELFTHLNEKIIPGFISCGRQHFPLMSWSTHSSEAVLPISPKIELTVRIRNCRCRLYSRLNKVCSSTRSTAVRGPGSVVRGPRKYGNASSTFTRTHTHTHTDELPKQWPTWRACRIGAVGSNNASDSDAVGVMSVQLMTTRAALYPTTRDLQSAASRPIYCDVSGTSAGSDVRWRIDQVTTSGPVSTGMGK